MDHTSEESVSKDDSQTPLDASDSTPVENQSNNNDVKINDQNVKSNEIETVADVETEKSDLKKTGSVTGEVTEDQPAVELIQGQPAEELIEDKPEVQLIEDQPAEELIEDTPKVQLVEDQPEVQPEEKLIEDQHVEEVIEDTPEVQLVEDQPEEELIEDQSEPKEEITIPEDVNDNENNVVKGVTDERSNKPENTDPVSLAAVETSNAQPVTEEDKTVSVIDVIPDNLDKQDAQEVDVQADVLMEDDQNDGTPEQVEMDIDSQEIQVDEDHMDTEPPTTAPVVSEDIVEEPENPVQFDDEFISADDDLNSVSVFFNISIDKLKNDKDLFVSLLYKMTDFEKFKSNTQILEINYEQLQHSHQKRMQAAKTEISNIKHEMDELVKSKAKIEQDFLNAESTLKSINSSSSKNARVIDEMKLKISELQKEKINASELLENKQIQFNELNTELKKLVDENKDLKNKINDLQILNEESGSESLKYKFELNKFEREVQLLTESRNWYEKELNNKLQEINSNNLEYSSKLNKYKSELEGVKQKYDISQTSLSTYQSNFSKATAQNNEYQFKIKELTDKLAAQESQYMTQISRKDEHIQVLEKSLKDNIHRIASLDELYANTTAKVEEDEKSYQKKFEDLENQIIERDVKIENLEKEINELSNQSVVFENNGIADPLSAQRTLNEIDSKITLTDLITNLNESKKETLREKRLKVKAQNELSHVLEELERKLPLLQSYQDKYEDIVKKEEKLNAVIQNLTNDKKNLSKTNVILKKKNEEFQLQIRNLNRYKIDLQRQICVLLTEMQFKISGDHPLTSEEKQSINNIVTSYGAIQTIDDTDTNRLISDRLSTFKNVVDLVKQNEKLLVISRQLGEDLENRDNTAGNLIEEAESSTIQRAKEAITKLQDQVKTLETQVQAANNAKDMLQNLFDSGVATLSEKKDIDATNERLNLLIEELKSKKEELSEVKKSYNSQIAELNTKVQNAISEKNEALLNLSKEQSTAELYKERVGAVQSTLSFVKNENEQLKSMLEKTNTNLTKLEANLQVANDSLVKTKSEMISSELKLKTLTAEKEVWKSAEQQLRDNVNKLYNEKAESNKIIISLQTIDVERQASIKETIQRYTNNIDSLQREVETLRAKLDKSNSEISNILHSKNTDSRIYQQRIDLLNEEYISIKDSLAAKEKIIQDLSEEVKNLKKRHSALDERKQTMLTSIGGNDGSNDVIVLKEELQHALEDLDIATKDSNQYKELAAVTEQQLNSLNETYTQYKQISEDKIKKITEEAENLKETITTLETEKEKIESDYNNLETSSRAEKQEFESKIKELNLTISTFDSIKNDYESKIEIIKSDVHSKEASLDEMNGLLSDKSNQIDTLETLNNIIKKESEDRLHELESIKNKLDESHKLLEEEKDNNKSTIVKLEQDLRNDKIRISELETQNRTLINQIEESPLSFGNSDDMKNLVSYLSREKDSLSQQLKYVQGEESILRKSITMKETEINELKVQILSLKEKSDAVDKYSNELALMKDEIQELSIYKENNKVLRDQIKLYENRINELESNIANFSNNSNNLGSEVEELKKQLSDKESKLVELNQQAEKLNTELANATGSLKDIAQKDAKITELTTKVEEKSAVIEKLRGDFNERLKKARTERQQALDEIKRLSDIQANTNNSDAQNELRLQIRKLNEEVHQKNLKIESINKENEKKVQESKNMIEELKKKIEELDKNSSSNVDIEALEAKYVKEKEEALKKLEEELKSKSTPVNGEDIEEFKKKLKAESDLQLLKEIESHKIKIRAPSQAKINEIVEKRAKAKREELEAIYENKIKELESKVGDNKGENFEEEKSKLLKQFEEEKEQLKKDIRTAVEKEKEFKEKILQGKITRLEQQIKKLEGEGKKTPSGPVSTNNRNPTTQQNMSAFGNMNNMNNMNKIGNMGNMGNIMNNNMNKNNNFPKFQNMNNMNGIPNIPNFNNMSGGYPNMNFVPGNGFNFANSNANANNNNNNRSLNNGSNDTNKRNIPQQEDADKRAKKE